MKSFGISVAVVASLEFDKANIGANYTSNSSKQTTNYWKKSVMDTSELYIGVKIPKGNVDWA